VTLIEMTEWRTDRVIGRLVACDCDVVERQTGKPGFCGTRFLLATVPGAHEHLWVTVAAVGAETVPVLRERLLEDEGVPRRVEQTIALAGAPWEVVTECADAAYLQYKAAEGLPAWMRRLPCGLLWETRGWVFGSHLTRVPRALWSLEAMYVPEGPHRCERYGQDERWSEAVVEGPVTEWRS
jgi:hypothetical protein